MDNRGNQERVLKYSAPEVCPCCKTTTEERVEKYGVAWVVYGLPGNPPTQVFQCIGCNIIVGTIHAMDNARKIKAVSEEKIIRPNAIN